MIEYNEYCQIIRPESLNDLKFGSGLIEKAKSYNDDVTKLLVYISELELEFQKYLFLKEKADEIYGYIATIKKIQDLTTEVLPLPCVIG